MHGFEVIYADYQATTPVDPRVVDKMAPYWSELFGNPHSHDHVVGWRAREALHNASSSVASLIGADADEIVFTSGATEANNLALIGFARSGTTTRSRILVGATEHKCVLGAARALAEQQGLMVEMIPVSREGLIDLDVLQKSLDSNVLIVSIMAVNNEVGTIQDIPRIAELLAPYDIPLHCDAAQAPCAMDISDLATHADLISLSGHKIYGPQGIGALYIRRAIQEQLRPLIHGGNQQGGLRAGTVPVPISVGMAVAAELMAAPEAAKERKKIAYQRDTFVRLLCRSDFPIAVNGPDAKHRHPGNANLRFDGFDARDILGVLQPKLAASTGAACASGAPEPSHVLRALGLSALESDASIRFSFGRFISDEKIEMAAHLVTEALVWLSTNPQTNHQETSPLPNLQNSF